MDARIAREEAAKFKTQTRERTWYEWFWGIDAKNTVRPTDVANDPILRAHFTTMLDHTEPPDTFKPSEVAQLLNKDELKKFGFETWQDAIPAVYELAFEMREFGECVIVKDGKLLDANLTLVRLDGPVRIGRSDV